MHGRMDGWMDGLMDEWMDGWMDGWSVVIVPGPTVHFVNTYFRSVA